MKCYQIPLFNSLNFKCHDEINFKDVDRKHETNVSKKGSKLNDFSKVSYVPCLHRKRERTLIREIYSEVN